MREAALVGLLALLLVGLAGCRGGGERAPSPTPVPPRVTFAPPTPEGAATLGPVSPPTAPPPLAAPTAPAVEVVPATAVPPVAAIPTLAAPTAVPSPTLDAYPVAGTRPPSGAGTPCRGGDITATAGWQGAGGALAGRLLITNAAAVPCVLQGRPAVQLVDGDGFFLPTTPAAPPTAAPAAGPLTLPPGGRAAAAVVWSNWCAAPPGGAISLVMRLAGDLTPLTVPALDPNGRGQRETPRCDLPGAGSTLFVGAFEPAPAR